MIEVKWSSTLLSGNMIFFDEKKCISFLKELAKTHIKLYDNKLRFEIPKLEVTTKVIYG
jgi:hypothetical protein